MAADKFLDELLVWRELAWHHCHHAVSDPRAWTALPTWARETLEAHHESTPLPLEALELGQTDSALWNLAQKSLLIHGELHNNLRMTWGKAPAPVVPQPATDLGPALRAQRPLCSGRA